MKRFILRELYNLIINQSIRIRWHTYHRMGHEAFSIFYDGPWNFVEELRMHGPPKFRGEYHFPLRPTLAIWVYTRKNATDLLQPVAPSGLIQVWYHSCWYQAVVAYRLFRTDGIRLEQSVGLSGLYQSDVTEWYRYVGNRLLQSVGTGCNRHDGPTALMKAVVIR